MRKKFKNCTIQNVVWKDGLPRLSFEVRDENGETHAVSIQNWSVSDQIAALMEGIRERAILACGMTDIDIFRGQDGQAVIDWSPCSGTSFFYEFPFSELHKLLKGGPNHA